MVLLGVNVDHVATVREARRTSLPDPVAAALLCEKAGCDSIVAHLREDRRHINDRDVRRLRARVTTRFNLEMSIAPEIVGIACGVKPDQATLVPERRQEITTEGGLDVCKGMVRITRAVSRLERAHIAVSLFIDPVKRQIRAARESGAGIIELHTGEYANARTAAARRARLAELKTATAYARSLGLEVNAGHGLDYTNTRAVARIPGMHELNIGHAIVARALTVGIGEAVREIRRCMR